MKIEKDNNNSSDEEEKEKDSENILDKRKLKHYKK